MDKITFVKGIVKKISLKVFSFFLFVFCFSGFAQPIQVTSVSPNPACSGQAITVIFTATNGNGNPGHYTPTSIFQAYLSSVGGVAPYTFLGNLTMSPYGFLPNNGDVNYGVQGTIVLPSNITGVYKIAVGSTLPTFDASAGAGASLGFTINTAPTGGSVTGGTTVCPNSNSTLLTLSGYTGTIDKWQSSTVSDFSSNVTDIVNTSTTYTATNLSVTTYYRAVMTNGSCPANSSATTVQMASGNPSVNQNICFNTQPANITLTNYQGTIQQWQSSVNNIDFVDIVGATSATLTSAQMGSLVETTYYRAVVDDVSCGVMNSNVVTVTVSTSSIGGTISPASTPNVCPSATTVLTLSGETGSIVKWQSSIQSNFNTDVVDIFNYTNTLTITNLTKTTYFRALVTSGGCAGAISTKAVVNVISGGPVGGPLSPNTTALCSATNSTVLTLNGATGTVKKWQSSPVSDFSSGVINITNTSTSYTVTNLATTTYYRVVVNKNSCDAYSSVASITVYPSLTVSITSNNGAICIGGNAIFNLSGTNNAIVTYTINGGTNQAVALSSTGTATVTVTGATSNQTLTLVSINQGVCSTAISGTSTVVVNTNVWTGAALDNQWNTPGNWSCGVLPNATTDVIIDSEATVIISGINALANTITLNNSVTLTVNSEYNVTVTNALNVGSLATMTLQNNANLIQVNNVANSGNIKANRESSALKRLDYTLWSSPVAAQNLLAFSPLTSTTATCSTCVNRFYVYNSATNAYSNSFFTPSANFQVGKAYLIRMPDTWGTTAAKWPGVFTGVPNNGNISFVASNGGAGLRFNGIGNPYPSPVSMTSFVNGNSGNITGTLYFWRKTNSTTIDPGYCTWTTAGSVFHSNGEDQVFDPNGIIRIGQGFLVEMLGNATTVNFTNAMRVADNANQFFKSSSEDGSVNGDRIWLNLTKSEGGFCQMLVGYFPNATLGVDYGIDGSVLGNPRPLLCSVIDNVDYVIQGRPPFVDTDEVKLNFKVAVAGQYTIAIDHVDGLFSRGQDIYIKDKQIKTLQNLKSAGYVFYSEAGNFPNRFDLVYRNSVLSTHSLDFNSQNIVVYKEVQDLIIKTNGILLDNVKIFDIQGRKIAEKNSINSAKTVFSNLNIANQVLLIQATSTEGVEVNKKIGF